MPACKAAGVIPWLALHSSVVVVGANIFFVHFWKKKKETATFGIWDAKKTPVAFGRPQAGIYIVKSGGGEREKYKGEEPAVFFKKNKTKTKVN